MHGPLALDYDHLYQQYFKNIIVLGNLACKASNTHSSQNLLHLCMRNYVCSANDGDDEPCQDDDSDDDNYGRHDPMMK